MNISNDDGLTGVEMRADLIKAKRGATGCLGVLILALLAALVGVNG